MCVCGPHLIARRKRQRGCTCGEMERLHSDLWVLIFSYFAQRPRLGVVSLVCKRWRTLCLRSFVHVDLRHPDDNAFALLSSSFPSLTSLALRPSWTTSLVLLPSSLRVLRLERPQNRRPGNSSGYSVQFAEKMPSCTSVSIECGLAGLNVIPLLDAARSSLTKLKLEWNASLAAYLKGTYFPALASLTFRDPPFSELPIATFLHNHATQLTRLSLSDIIAQPTNTIALVRRLPFPKLRTLKWHAHMLTAEETQAMLTHMPQLQSFSAGSLVRNLYDVDPSLLTSLTSIVDTCIDPARLDRFPRLRHLYVPFDNHTVIVAFKQRSFASLFTAVYMNSPSMCLRGLAALLTATQLTSITLGNVTDLSPGVLRRIRFPNLVSFCLTSVARPAQFALRVTGWFVRRCGALRKVSIFISPPDPLALQQLRDFLSEAEKRAIVAVTVLIRTPKVKLAPKIAQLRAFAESLSWTNALIRTCDHSSYL